MGENVVENQTICDICEVIPPINGMVNLVLANTTLLKICMPCFAESIRWAGKSMIQEKKVQSFFGECSDVA